MTATTPPADRDAWLASRKKHIGASDLSAIIGVSPYASSWDVWADKTDRVAPWTGNHATRLGQLFEQPVLDFAEAELGELERNVRVLHTSLPLAATLDARVIASGVPVEAKTTGLAGPVYGTWGIEKTDEVPDYYVVQVHAEMMCTAAEIAYLYALIPGRGIVQYAIERSDKLHDQLANLIDEWWTRHIVDGEEPSREKASLEVVKRLRKTPNKIIAFPDDVCSYLDRREALKKQASTIDDEIASIDSQVRLHLGDAEEGVCADGRSVSCYETQRKGYVVEPTVYRALKFLRGKPSK